MGDCTPLNRYSFWPARWGVSESECIPFLSWHQTKGALFKLSISLGECSLSFIIDTWKLPLFCSTSWFSLPTGVKEFLVNPTLEEAPPALRALQAWLSLIALSSVCTRTQFRSTNFRGRRVSWRWTQKFAHSWLATSFSLNSVPSQSSGSRWLLLTSELCTFSSYDSSLSSFCLMHHQNIWSTKWTGFALKC